MLKQIFLSFTVLLLFFFAGCSKPPAPTAQTNEKINPLRYPVQKKLDKEKLVKINLKKGYVEIRCIYSYDVNALIASKEHYNSWDWAGELAPYDFALVWGDLAIKDNYEFVKFWQGGRWYHFKLRKNAPFGLDFVYKNSSNNHLIPKNENIKRALKIAKRWQPVRIKGYLVSISGKINNRNVWWQSSFSRDDRGSGSCEVIFVTSIQIGNNIYE